jgi:hypothetical protein
MKSPAYNNKMQIPAKALLVLLCTSLAVATVASAAEPGKLLPTSSLSKQVSETARLFSESPPDTTVESRRRTGLRLRDKISEFIIAQMQAMPEISQELLRTQLRAILCPNTSAGCDSNHPPYVFTNLWGGTRGSSQFVVSYALSLGYVGGSVTVIESYVRDNSTGNVRRTQRGGNDFDGYVPNFQMVAQCFNPDEIWLLAWGNVEGASGRGLSGRATVYRVGVDVIQSVWDDAKEDNVTAQRNEIGWEVNYADPKRLYGDDPKPYFLDIYRIDSTKRAFSRIVHYQYSPD